MKGTKNTRKTGHEVIRFISAAYSPHIITKHMDNSRSPTVHIGRVFSITDAPATFGSFDLLFSNYLQTASISTDYSRPSRETQNQESKSVLQNVALSYFFP